MNSTGTSDDLRYQKTEWYQRQMAHTPEHPWWEGREAELEALEVKVGLIDPDLPRRRAEADARFARLTAMKGKDGMSASAGVWCHRPRTGRLPPDDAPQEMIVFAGSMAECGEVLERLQKMVVGGRCEWVEGFYPHLMDRFTVRSCADEPSRWADASWSMHR